MIKVGKVLLCGIWLLTVVGIFACFLVHPEAVSPEALVRFLKSFHAEILLSYIFVTMVRGFFLIPSTPFVLAGGMLFPHMPFIVLLISLAGVLSSATVLYYFSDLLGFSKYLEATYPQQLKIWKERLNQPRASLFVCGWAFFPLVPTDLICYGAGIVKMPYRYMITGVLAGELILDIFLVYCGVNFVKLIFSA